MQLLDKIKSLRPEDGNILAKFVKDAADARGSGLKSRADLFYQTEPFARELDQYGLADPGDRGNRASFTISNRLTAIGGKQQLVKYRAMLFAWLSYYHPDEAITFCKRVGVDLPFYDGHPDLRECSEEAVELFFKQEPNAQSDSEERAALASAATTRSEVEKAPKPDQAEQIASPQDGESPAPSEDLSSEKEGSSRRLVILGSLVALLLASVAVIAAVNPNIFELSSTDDSTATEPPPSGLALNGNSTETEVDSEDENIVDAGDDDAVAPEADTGLAVAAPEPTRQINPVWNNITGFAWSTKELNYFYPTLRSANRSDLLEAARQGNTAAQTLTAVGYHSGRLGQTDHGLEIREYLRPACANGQGRACTLLGVHYRAGWGVPKDNARAAEFYSKGCRLGNLTGCHYEGVRYLNGEGVAQDLPRAIATFQNTCELGVAYSCYFLSAMYGQGMGVEQNLQRAGQYEERYQRLRTPQ